MYPKNLMEIGHLHLPINSIAELPSAYKLISAYEIFS